MNFLIDDTMDTNMSTLFSLCIPAYNAAGQITSCLESICGQDFSDYEVVIADDGSDDPLSIEGLAGHFDGGFLDKIRIAWQENRGTYAARQKAMQEAHGRYVFCMDADDRLATIETLGEMADALELDAFPDALLINAAREDGAPCVDYAGMGSCGPVPRGEVVDRFFLDSGWNSMFTMAFRRSVFRPSYNRPRLRMAEDRLQKAEVIAGASSFALLDRPLYVYRKVEGSKMNSPFEIADFDDRVYVGCRIREMLGALGASEGMWAKSFNAYVMASLFEFARDASCGREGRMRTYASFREAEGCDEALSNLGNDMRWKDAVCLDAFAKRRWSALDGLLRAGCRLSRAKEALSMDGSTRGI